MSQLVLGLVIFLGAHSVGIFAPAWRDRAIARLGEWPWKGLHSLVSIVGFVLIVRGYAAARLDPHVLYVPPVALRHVAAVLMLPVFPLLLAAYLPGRIKDATKHPMLAATKAWALAHLLANGTLADVLLFGGFLAWAVADRIAAGRRAVPRKIHTANRARWNDAIAVVGGLVLYAVFVGWAHQALIGVSPFTPLH